MTGLKILNLFHSMIPIKPTTPTQCEISNEELIRVSLIQYLKDINQVSQGQRHQELSFWTKQIHLSYTRF